MKTSIRIAILTLGVILLTYTNVMSQTCTELEQMIVKPDTSFNVDFTRSFKVNKNSPLMVVYTFYGKNDYYFSIVGKEYLGNLQFKLFETSNGKLLFDSSLEQYCTRKIITFNSTMNVSIDVITPYWKFPNGDECIRLLIGSRYSIINNFDFSKEPE